MKTEFTKRQLRDENIQLANDAFRTCVHCGLCTATCSSYVVLKDERDSPRGRIYLIKEMLESKSAPSENLVTHMDRCLTCLSCMTTCPAGVDYMHLADVARVEIEKKGNRSFGQRFLRRMLSLLIPYPRRFLFVMRMGRMFRWMRYPIGKLGFKEFATMLELLPKGRKSSAEFQGGGVARPRGHLRKRVILMTGCAQQVIRPAINDASIRLMAGQGIEVIVVPNAGCCGAIDQHLGREKAAEAHVRRMVSAWRNYLEDGPIDGIISNASGCGTMIKDYPHLFRSNKKMTALLEPFKDKFFDISEFMTDFDLGTPEQWSDLKVAVHIPCSMMHGQQIKSQPAQLIEKAGFKVLSLDEAHICCGSAGTYNMLQPEIARALGEKKAAHIANAKPDLIASGNLGCITQLAHYADLPVVHFVELLDWAYGGPTPEGLAQYKHRIDYLKKESA